ncbi:hypothetical protein PQQ63_15180 [Paraburkholderia metrosideri]|uniref:Uncharacterized protein n=1 Tax=Paraburkholderia metrosideri TaxID=580937 RepID=A0ABW9DU20_9BURK
MNEAFGAGSKLHVEPEKTPLRDKILAFVLFAAIGAGWYLLVAIKAGA